MKCIWSCCCRHVPHLTRKPYCPENRNALYTHRNSILIITNSNYETYCVDTDVAEIMANAANMNRACCRQEYGNKKTYVPWDQWIKLSQEQKDTGKILKVNTSKLTPSTIQVDDSTNYLYKGESIKVDGHQYFAHSTNINYWIGQHDVAGMEYALVDRGANGGGCGEDMLVVKGSERFVEANTRLISYVL
jgi:hypothetical protein